MNVRQLLHRELGKPSQSNILFWCFGLILTALGVCLTAKSGFGVSMVVAPAYVLHLKVSESLSWFTFGIGEYCIQACLLIIMISVMRGVRLKYLLTFGTALIYGQILDLWRRIFGTDMAAGLPSRIIYAAAGILICALAIAMMFRTSLPQEAYEMFVKDISERFHRNINRFKWGYDLVSLFVAIGMMLAFFHRFSFEMIGIGTLVMAFVNAPLIAMFGRIIDRIQTPPTPEAGRNNL